MVAAATVVRFDGSDSMPGAVGTGSFWKEMTSWVSGQVDELETALKDIDASWPTQVNSFFNTRIGQAVSACPIR